MLRGLVLSVLLGACGGGPRVIGSLDAPGGSSTWRCPLRSVGGDGTASGACSLDPVVGEARWNVGATRTAPLPPDCASVHRILIEDDAVIVQCGAPTSEPPQTFGATAGGEG